MQLSRWVSSASKQPRSPGATTLLRRSWLQYHRRTYPACVSSPMSRYPAVARGICHSDGGRVTTSNEPCRHCRVQTHQSVDESSPMSRRLRYLQSAKCQWASSFISCLDVCRALFRKSDVSFMIVSHLFSGGERTGMAYGAPTSGAPVACQCGPVDGGRQIVERIFKLKC